MALPDFLIIGAQKCGTTWLADQLGRHPEVFMAAEEIHFFDKANNFDRGVGWYEEHFTGGQGRLIGEKTPDYLWTGSEGAEGHVADAHRRLHGVLPEAKLIIVVRNPVDRAMSALTHLIRTRRVSPLHSVDALLLGDKQRLIHGHGVLEKGMYHRQLHSYAELFPPEQMLILIFEEDIAERPAEGMRKVLDFLGLEPAVGDRSNGAERNASRRSRIRLISDYYFPPLRPISGLLDRFSSPWKPALNPISQHALYQLYEEDTRLLFRWLNRAVPDSWLEPDRRRKISNAKPGLPSESSVS